MSRSLRAAIAALSVVVAGVGLASTVSADEVGLRFPAPRGTEWQIIAGYNTSTHLENDAYAIDLVRTDRATAGTPVLAPLSGTIGYASDSCVSIRSSNVNVMMCHVFPADGLDRGDPVAVGQRIAEVAPDGEANNNGLAHIHLAVNEYEDWRRGERRGEGGEREGGERASLPFTGDYRLEGQSLARSDAFNAHAGTRFVSTNHASLGRPNVSAGRDFSVGAGETVTLEAEVQGALQIWWGQLSGPAVQLQPLRDGTQAQFTAPDAPGSELEFQVVGTDGAEVIADTIRVTVRAGGTLIADDSRGRMVSGSIPERGIGLVVFGGGSNADLVGASGCTAETVAFWTTVEGQYVGYIPAAQVPLVNERWLEVFPGGLPAGIALVARCR